MSSTRKPDPRNVLLHLPEEQQAQLVEWLIGGMPYHEAKVMLEKEFGVAVKSLNTFTNFWGEVCVPHMLAKRRRMGDAASQRMNEAEASPAPFDAAALDAIQQRAFEMAEDPQAKATDVRAILGLMLKARDQELSKREMEQKQATSAREHELREEHLKLEKEKFVAAMRTKLQAGLDAVAEAFKGSPQAMELYGKARAMIGESVKAE